MEKDFFEDYTVGEKFVSPGRTVTESDITAFAGFTGDWHELHTNREYAEKSIFGERVAHGVLVFALGSALGLRLGKYVLTPRSFIALYGFERVRFVNPVKIGDTLHLETEIKEMIEKDEKRGVFVSENFIKNQRDEDCCIYMAKVLCGRRHK